MTPKQRVHAVFEGTRPDRTPVTPIFMMWAAQFIGRSYRDYYLDADILAQAQLAVAAALHTDQVSAISDPWREAADYGMTFDWPEQAVGVPHGYLLADADDVQRLRRTPDQLDAAPRMADRVRAVGQMADAVGATHSVLGWVEGPMAAYADLREISTAMVDLMERPGMFDAAAELLVCNAVYWARRQVQAGADVIGVGDAAASLIGPELYRRHVQPWHRVLFDGIHDAGGRVKLHICGDINAIVADLAAAGPDVIDCDWMVPLAQARARVGPGVALCGNLDPVAVLAQGSPAEVATAAQRNIAEAGDRFILQPGCEVPPSTPIENLRAMCPPSP